MNWWAATFALWTMFYVSVLAIVTVPDYPYHTPLWQSLTVDATGYWHEAFYITVGWLSGCALVALALVFSRIKMLLEALEKVFEGV